LETKWKLNAGIKGPPKFNNALGVFHYPLFGGYCTFCKMIYTETFIRTYERYGGCLIFNILLEGWYDVEGKKAP